MFLKNNRYLKDTVPVTHTQKKTCLVIFFVEGDAGLAEQGGDVGAVLREDKVELLVGLVHLVALQEAEVGAAQQVVLLVHQDLVRGGVEQGGLREQLALLVPILHLVCLLKKIK